MDSVVLVQVGSAFVLNAAFAWLLGSWLARRWLLAAGAGRIETEDRFHRGDVIAGTMGLFGIGAGLWASTAVMGGVGLAEARDLFWQMLTTTSIGRSGSVALVAIALVLGIRAIHSTAVWREWITIVLLAVFALVRASMGHAGENGYLTVPFAAEVVHLTAMGVWLGLVTVSASQALATRTVHDPRRVTSYLESMSSAAMLAVIAVIITGLFNAWHRVGTVENLLDGSVYTAALIAKGGLVSVALLLGGYNKYFGLAHARRSTNGLRYVISVLRVESVVLAAVLLAAAMLTSQQPPAAM